MAKILILGGGFGGIRAALDLRKKLKDKAQITLIDKNGYHLFLPALYEVASAYGVKRDPFAVRLKKSICIPYSSIFEGKNLDFIQDEVTKIDLNGKKVFADARVFEYDYLLLALGSQTNDFGIPGVREYAYQFKSIDDALMINKKIEGSVKRSSASYPVKIFICGGGFTGVELAAELSCCAKQITKTNKIKHKAHMVTLFEAGPKILPMIPDEKRQHLLRRLTKLGISVMENSPIEEVGPDFIKLKNGQSIDGDIIVWTAGIKANELLRSVPGLPLSQNGKVVVEESLKVKGMENVFAVGDNVEFIDSKTQKPVPALAYVANDQGKVAAKNLINTIRGKALKQYKPFYSVWVAPAGGKYAVAHLWKGIHITGFWGWVVRELIDLRYMLSILPPGKAVSLMWQEVTLFTKND
ncbi:MAG: NAD(P)/FAD-dependent oxidoreductase [Candidatus Yanofskybacteria bacterium]|nr:NAD(P)/FAD-dependent oxidoreductase [Candidatus Yanofskybacteria bacterium]